MLSKRKLPISIRFRLRDKAKRTTYLQIRITVNGYEDAGFMARWEGQPLYVNPSAWKQQKQEVTTRYTNDITNLAVASIKAQIQAIFLDQKKRYAPIAPTTDSVKYEFCEGLQPVLTEGRFSFPIWAIRRVGAAKPSRKRAKELAMAQHRPLPSIATIRPETSLLDAYAAYISELESRNGSTDQITSITLGRWRKGLEYLTRYITEIEKGYAPTIQNLKIGFLNRYHRWLQKIPAGRHANKGLGAPMSVEQASRYTLKISDVYSWLIEEGVTETNPVRLRSWPKGNGKEVYYLEPHHLQKLFRLRYQDVTMDATLWWLQLMCLTGMDYPDAQKYVANRAAFEQVSDGRQKIVICRNKPPHNECHIPFLAELGTLLDSGIRPLLEPQTINRYLKIIAGDVGFTKKMTIKIARKTAGAMFLYKGYSIAAVSRILGHDSIQTTETYYVKVRGSLVDQEMKQVSSRVHPQRPLPPPTSPAWF